MRSSPRRRPAALSPLGLWLATLALMVLVAAPLLGGRAHAGMRDCMAAPAATAQPHQRSDATCAEACALCGQVLEARAEAAAPVRLNDGPADYAVLDRRPAGVAPELSTPPPR